MFQVKLDSFQPRLERIQCVEPNTQTIMDFDFSEFERSFVGGSQRCEIPLVFDLVESGFPLSDEFEAAQTESPKRDPPQEPSSTSSDEEPCDVEEEEEDVEHGFVRSFHDSTEESGSDSESLSTVNALAQPTHSGAALNTPRTQRDRLDYEEGRPSGAWVHCDAWVGAICTHTDDDVRLLIPGVDAVQVFSSIGEALETQNLPATEQLCRILLARILFAWEVSLRVALLRNEGRLFPNVAPKTVSEFEPTVDWVWSVFGPLDSCDRVDVPAVVKSNGKCVKLTIETPVWIWWYISLVFTVEEDRLVPRSWTCIDQIAEYSNCIKIEASQFSCVIQAAGVAALYKRHVQTSRGARFFARQHPIFDVRGMENIFCMTMASLGSALSSGKNKNNRVVQRREAKWHSASRMRRHIGIFNN